jgi:O-methyltransferase
MSETGWPDRLETLQYEARQLNFSSPVALADSLRLQWLLWKVRKYTMVLRPRLRALYHLAQTLDRIPVAGDIVECGVYNGGSAGVLAYASRAAPPSRSTPFRPHARRGGTAFGARDERRADGAAPPRADGAAPPRADGAAQPARGLWLFDSFQGLPPASAKDGDKAQDRQGTCLGSEQNVRRLMGALGIAESRLHVVKGWFEDTFPTVQIERIALLHIDADWYESVRLSLERFYDAVAPGGFVVLDDYGHWLGCRHAVDEFFAQRRLQPELVEVDYTGRYLQKKG